jgi:Domain of unknown function (DUF4350)
MVNRAGRTGAGMSATAQAPSSATAQAPSTAWRGWVAAAGAVVLSFVLFGLVADAFAPGPQGPAESSFATSPSGLAAWAELLNRAGHPVGQLRAPLASAQVSPSSTLVVIGATDLSPGGASHLRTFVDRGGRLVLGGGALDRVMPALISSPPSWNPTGPRTYSVGGRSVVTAGAGSFGGTRLLSLRSLGSGTVVLLADSSPVENRLLGLRDNAQLAIDLAGPAGRPVVFAEALHGYGQATGLAAIPGNWWLAFAGLALAGGTWALSRGRRLGPPESPPPPAVPPRSAYVEALAATLLRARDPQRVARLASEAAAEARRRT